MHDLTVEKDEAGAANAHFASRMRTGQFERLAQEIRQGVARRNAARHFVAVDRHADIDQVRSRSCLDDLAEQSAQKNAREVALHRRRHMLILGRVEVVADERLGRRHRGLVQSLADQTLLGLSGTQRRVSNGKEHDADVLDPDRPRNSARMPQPTSA